ncbi:glycerophosphodiester phosphodiesterase [Pseudomonas typographi]|uniref:Glycerophosphodiester phosphodiesterase n=1 Tax=Pseudomonas typographi TaxID=2715964 RepID=A0ABR7YWB8_9PSED|nr:glycerophosphodiester phosphodiesterase [Pseudomonas typographi]MBD1597493.1 glycerophosphodiester phosphodiesterase [Pseudomonas typographi]
MLPRPFNQAVPALALALVTLCAQAQTPAQIAQALNIPHPAVIAHRGASFDAPESTRASYLTARDLGADYLEMDLQRTRDGVLIALHDENLTRTTDIATRFPDRKDKPVSEFTLAELKSLDAGSWFNTAYPERARPAFKGLQVLTLDEIIDIAEGNPAQHPGLYMETKVPSMFPGIEHDLKLKLQQRGWLGADGQVASGKRVVLQTFEKPSLELLAKEMPTVPKILLLWVGEGGIEPASDVPFAQSGAKDKAAYYAMQQPKSRQAFESWLDFAKANGAIGTGPSAALAQGGDQSYMDLVQPWMNKMTHDKGLLIHVYTVDDPVDFKTVMAAGVDGVFTNRAAQLLTFYGRPPAKTAGQLLDQAGY